MTALSDARRVLRAEVVAAVRGQGPALWVGVAFIVAVTGLVGGRSLAQGTLAGTGAYDVTVQVVRATLPVAGTIVAGLRYAQRCRLGLDRELYLAGISRPARLAVVVADGAVVLAAAWLGEMSAVAVGAGGLGRQPARDLGTLLVGTALGVVVLAAVSAMTVRLAGSTAGFVVVALGAPLVGSLLSWAGFVYPVLDALAQVWPWQAATTFVSPGSPGRYGVGALTSVAAVAVAAAVLSRDPRQPAQSSSAGRPEVTTARVHSRPRRATAAVLSVLAVVPIAWGAAVPAALSRFVPWYLRPEWLAEQARHASSQDVAIAWLRAVQAEDREAERRLAVGPVERLAGPLRPWLAHDDPTTATMDRTYGGNPGEVAFGSTPTDHGIVPSWSVYVCLVHSASAWRVSAVRSAPDCPRPPT